MATLEADAEGFTFQDGDWLEDYGDAPFYGLAYYARRGHTRTEPARQRALAILEKADFFEDDLQELVTSTLGLIDRIESTGDKSDAEKIEAFVDRLDRLVSLLCWYIEGAADRSWALATYGPTSIAALVGLTNAQYALIVGSEARRDFALEMARKIEEKAWIDGRNALPSDPEYFCAGCNLQLLYVMQYRIRTGAGP
jgi:hypothetical protein